MGIMGTGYRDVEVSATGLTEKNGSMQINVQFLEPETGDTITAYLFTTDKAWPYTEEKLRNIGWDPVSYSYQFEDLNQDPSPLRGNKANILVESETYNGEARNKVKFINAPGGGMKRMEDAEAVDFAAKLRARLTGQSYSAPAQTRRPGGGGTMQAPSGADDDIPFVSIDDGAAIGGLFARFTV